MSIKQQLDDYLNKRFNVHIEREKGAFGCSDIGWCMKKVFYRRKYEQLQTRNPVMIMGSIYHDILLPELVHKVYKFNRRNPKEKPIFDAVCKFDADGKFKIEGHPDVILPNTDCVVEFKTTYSERIYEVGEFITDTYIMQVNAYACMMQKHNWQIWILSTESPIELGMITQFEGKADLKLFDEFLERCDFINQALDNPEIELSGPEQEFECKKCDFVTICDKWRDNIKTTIESLDKHTSKKDFGELSIAIDILSDHKYIKYSREDKKYELTDRGKEIWQKTQQILAPTP